MSLTRWLKPLLFALAAWPLATPAADYTLGKEYTRVREPVATADANTITVEEFFWYGCPHCFHADPTVDAWRAKKAADVDFQRVPNTLGHTVGELHMRAFYVAETLGLGEKLHKPLFAAIHERHMPLDTPERVKDFFVSQGVKPDDFDRASSSFVVDSRMRRAQQLAVLYSITSVPTFVVGGRYSTSPTMAGSPEKTMQVVDFLIDKIRKEHP